MKKRNHTPHEKDEQAALFQWADVMAFTVPQLVMLHAIPNTGGLGGGFTANRGMVASMIRQGMKKGYPDIGLDVPAGNRHGLRIELKRRVGGNLRDPDQMAWRARLTSYGYACETCCGWQDAARCIALYLRPVLSASQRNTLEASIPVG